MILRMVRTRLAGRVPGSALLAILTLGLCPPATAGHPCDRYALDGLTLGMSSRTVMTAMGGTGMGTSIRLPDGGDSNGVLYPGAPHEIYVEYDRRIEQRKAQVVRVRSFLVLSPGSVQDLVRRFGQPDAGADDLRLLLPDGPAVWIDRTCGLVVTAFRQASSWWAAEGGARLQVETFELAQRSDSPARSRLTRGANTPEVARFNAAPPAPSNGLLADDLTLPEPQQSPVSDAPPRRISYVKPVYPPTAKWLGMKGQVTLAILVQPDGTVGKSVSLINAIPAGRGFEEASIEAVREWRFRPAIRGGIPTASRLNVTIDIQ